MLTVVHFDLTRHSGSHPHAKSALTTNRKSAASVSAVAKVASNRQMQHHQQSSSLVGPVVPPDNQQPSSAAEDTAVRKRKAYEIWRDDVLAREKQKLLEVDGAR